MAGTRHVRWWTVPVNVAASVALRLPGAVIGTGMMAVLAGLFGPAWGTAIIYGWMAAGVLTLTGAVEGLLAATVFRYRRAADSWLAEEVDRLAPGRRCRVYVAPGTCGVFALGGHTVGIGEHSVGAGGPTPALLQSAAAAVDDLRRGRTRAELAMGLWAFPWFFAKLTAAAILPRRLHAVARVAAACWCTAATVASAGHGQQGAAILGAFVVTDLLLTAHTRRRRRHDANARPVPKLSPASPAPMLTRAGSL